MYSKFSGQKYCLALHLVEMDTDPDIESHHVTGRYLAAVAQLVSWASELGPSLPWLVNTMGWCKGLGLLLMKGTYTRYMS